MEYEVLGPGAVLLHLSLKSSMGPCSALLFPHIIRGQTLPHLRSQMQSPELLSSPFLAEHPVQLWAASVLLWDQAMGGCG